jgi:hypothetical protein
VSDEFEMGEVIEARGTCFGGNTERMEGAGE